MKQELSRSGSSRAVVLVKALPQVSEVYGETVCVAAIDDYGRWKRLYPVTFRDLAPEQRFSRWDLITFDWQLRDAAKDRRAESVRVDQASIKIERELTKPRREAFLNRTIVTGTKKEHAEGRSLALLKADSLEFYWKRRSDVDLAKIRAEYVRLQAAPADLFGIKRMADREPAPFDFCYRYHDDDGPHDARCHDWETEATFLSRRHDLGEKAALEWMGAKFGEEFPQKGMLLAMGTHSQRNWQWMIVGVIRLDPVREPTFL